MKNISSSNLTSNLPPSFGFFLFSFKEIYEIATFVFSSLRFQHPFKKKIISQIGAFPPGWGVKVKNVWNHLPVVFLYVYKLILQKKYMLPSCSTFHSWSHFKTLNAFNSFCWRQKPLELLTFQKRKWWNTNLCQEAPAKNHVRYAFGTIFWTLGGIFVSLKNKFMENVMGNCDGNSRNLTPRSRSFSFFPIFSYPDFLWAPRVLRKKWGHLVSLKHMRKSVKF